MSDTRAQFTASIAATEPRAYRRLTSEAKATLSAMELAIRMVEDSHPITARRLRWRVRNLRSALEAMES